MYATNGGGTTGSSIQSLTTTATTPSTPNAPTAVAGVAQATVTVADSGTGGTPDSFTVTAVQDGSKTCTVTGASGSCTVTGLTNGTAYTFTTTATNGGGTSSASSPSNSVTPQAAVPSVPNAPTAVAGVAQATVTVADSGTGGTPASFTVTAVQDGSKTCTVTGASGSCTVTGLTNGSAYTFTTTATNGGGTSSASSPSNSVTPQPATPSIPNAPTAVAGVAAATITVADSGTGGTPASFAVTAVEDGSKTCTVTGSSGSCTVSGLTNGNAYTFKATATNGGGTSGLSSASNSVTPQPAVPGAPPAPTGVPGVGLVTLTVAAPTTGGTPVSYLVTNVQDASKSCTVTGAAGSCDISGLSNGIAYTFTATATNGGGTSPASSPSAAITLGTPGPPAVSNVVVTDTTATVTAAPSNDGGTPTQITITATESSSAAARAMLHVTVGPSVHASSLSCTATAPAFTCVIDGLIPGHNYSFTAVAASPSGTGAESQATPTVVTGAPSTPSISGVVPGDAEVTVSVTVGSSGGTPSSYTVASGSHTCSIAWGQSSCVVSGLTNGTGYTFTVTATNGAGTSDPSAASVEVTPSANPSPPTGTTGEATAITPTSATLSATVNATGDSTSALSIKISTVRGDIAAGNGNSLTVSPGVVSGSATVAVSASAIGLTHHTVYYYRVSATTRGGTTDGDIQQFTTAPVVAGVPTALDGNPADGQVSLSWVAPTDNGGAAVAGYQVLVSSGGSSFGAVSAGSCSTASQSSATTCIATGLRNGFGYVFTVAAINSAGTGTASDQSAGFTPLKNSGMKMSIDAPAQFLVGMRTRVTVHASSTRVPARSSNAADGTSAVTVSGRAFCTVQIVAGVGRCTGVARQAGAALSLSATFDGVIDGDTVSVPNGVTNLISVATVNIASAKLRRDGARVVVTLRGSDVAANRHISIWRQDGKRAAYQGTTFMTPNKTWTWAMYTAPPSAGAVKTVTVRVGDGHQKTGWLTVTMNRNQVLSITTR